MSLSLLGYSTSNAAGITVDEFWDSLKQGKPLKNPDLNFCPWPVGRHFSTAQDRINFQLHKNWDGISSNLKDEVRGARSIGVILATTKGIHEDFIWNATPDSITKDFLSPILARFIAETELAVTQSTVVSNACASTHSAIFLADLWIASGKVSHCIILSCDQIGRFVIDGFKSLGALTATYAQPFGKERTGLQLGDGAAILVLSRPRPGKLNIENISIVTEGTSVTRPAIHGEGLKQACLDVLNNNPIVDLIIAHGTGTILNDRVESLVFGNLFPNKTPITCTKWAIGHTLGASGAMDLVAAAEALIRQDTFSIATTAEPDPSFPNYFLCGSNTNSSSNLGRILITSLGFGGINAALTLTMRHQ